MSVPLDLLDVLEKAPAKNIAITLPEAELRITYGSLREQVTSMAAALAGAGIGPGDRVAMALPNGLPAIVSFLAASIAGTAAPLNPAYRRDEFAFYLEDTNARALIVPPDGADEARQAAAGRIPVLPVEMDARGTVKPPIPAAGSVARPAADAVALVLHTSGSTGRPKRVPLTHRNLAASIGNIAATYRLDESDVSLCVMPLFHVHGLMASTLAAFLSGGSVVAPRRFNAMSFHRMLRDYSVTWYSAVPTMHQLAIARKAVDGHVLRFVRSCSAALSPDVMAAMEGHFGVPVLEAYGMTEASHQMASNPLPPEVRKPGTVGRGTGVAIRIMDSAGRALDTGDVGEVCIQGPNVIREYENNPEATAQSFFGDWFRTGDQGVLDADGYLRLTGRIKELIVRGGEKIAPREIDDALLAHPLIAEAVAFGMPHSTLGEEVGAAVVLRDSVSEHEMIAFCRERLAAFKSPKRIFVVKEIPRTATGKIQRLHVAASLREPR